MRDCDLIAVYLPMHTATRLAAPVFRRARTLNPTASICAFGLYAPVNAEFLTSLGVNTIIGGEFERSLAALADAVAAGADAATAPEQPLISLDRLRFEVPDRSDLPPLNRYATLHLTDGSDRVTGYTETTRGCKHTCRHCPIVPVYRGRFRVVQRDVVLADVAQQVAAGAAHITFGDPDFFNAPAHAAAVVDAMHARFPDLTYDVTVKVQHLVARRDLVAALRRTGCVMVTTAVEAMDPTTLEALDKRHTHEDFREAVALLRAEDIALNPTFVAFTPWTTLDTYVDLLATVGELRLVASVAPIQYAIRLLIPNGSLLLDQPQVRQYLRGFDPAALCHTWKHPDPDLDRLQQEIFDLVSGGVAARRPRHAVYDDICAVVGARAGTAARERLDRAHDGAADCPPTPFLSEQWYCCAEPPRTQVEASV